MRISSHLQYHPSSCGISRANYPSMSYSVIVCHPSVLCSLQHLNQANPVVNTVLTKSGFSGKYLPRNVEMNFYLLGFCNASTERLFLIYQPRGQSRKHSLVASQISDFKRRKWLARSWTVVLLPLVEIYTMAIDTCSVLAPISWSVLNWRKVLKEVAWMSGSKVDGLYRATC